VSSMKKDQILYRAIASARTNCAVWYEEYRVDKVTPKGAWLVHHNPQTINDLVFLSAMPMPTAFRTWRSHDTRFAMPTKKEALWSLFARKCSHVAHARRRYNSAIHQSKATIAALREAGVAENELPKIEPLVPDPYPLDDPGGLHLPPAPPRD
jgi:hypothetical protein